MSKQKRFLIGHLGMYGDILYATTIARQLKQDYPGCHITWGVASLFKSILDNNPYIDSVWEYDVKTREEITSKWFEFAELCKEKKQRGEYDEIFLSQIFPGNPDRLYDTIRQSIFRAYPGKITVPLPPVVILSQREIDHVKLFAVRNLLLTKQNVILFEISPGSCQSVITRELVMQISKRFVKIPGTVVILSGREPIDLTDPAIIDGSGLSYRETLALTKYCTFLIGSSSGITWIAQAEGAKQLPTVQILTEGSIGSLINDHKYHGLSTDDIIELVSPPPDQISDCIIECLNGNFAQAKETYSDEITPDFAVVRRTAYYKIAKNHISNIIGIRL